GATGQSFPNSYQEDGELIGFDVEVLETIAKNLGYKVQWTLAGFEGLVGQLGVGKLDTIANAFEYTEERAEQYNYSTTYSYTSTGIAVLKDSP
ncbi:transporter substrate-binding domain-containing protein, partial [Vibrio cholerae]|nr:transporter substrate-binding domain-containing protein [Vibrio cholerae]